MSATLDTDVLQIDVRLDAPGVSRAGFGTMLIGGPNLSTGRRVEYATTAAAVLALDGITSSTPEYTAAVAAFSNGAGRVAIGLVGARVAQVDTWTIDTADAGEWVLSIAGTDYSFTAGGGDDEEAIATGLRAAVNSDVDAVVTASGTGADVVLTADVAGRGFVSGLGIPGAGAATLVATTPNRSVVDELAACAAESGDWYGLVLTSRVDEDIRQAATWTEAELRIFAAQSDDSDILTGGGVFDALAALSLDRTAGIWHADDAEAADAAWMASRLAVSPDESATTWAFVTLAGVTVDALTESQKNEVLDLNANVYLPLKGIAATFPGKVFSGRYLDEIVTRDWYRARIEEGVAQAFLDATSRGSKIPHSNDGYAVFEQVVRSVTSVGVAAGHFLSDSLELQFPRRSDVSQSDVVARIYRASGSVGLAGAVHTLSFTISATYAQG